MYVDVVPNRNSPPAILLREAWRDGKAIRKRTLANLRQLGLERLLASQPSRSRDLVVAMIVARILEPRSKLATARGLDPETSTLAEALHLEQADEDELYSALDWLLARQPKIETALARRHLDDHTLVLYDVTSTYFEGRTC